MFPAEDAQEFLTLIGEHADAAAERKYRAVYDLIFSTIGRVYIAMDTNGQIALYRHTLVKPLAFGISQWWETFKPRCSLAHEAAAGASQAYSAGWKLHHPQKCTRRHLTKHLAVPWGFSPQ